MLWINGIKRDAAGSLKVAVQASDGIHSQMSLRDLKTSRFTSRRKYDVVELDLRDLRPGCTLTYMAGAGIAPEMERTQKVYQYTTGHNTMMVPAQLLVLGLLGPLVKLRQHLMTPLAEASFKPLYSDPTRSELDAPQNGCTEQLSLHARLSWIQRYPSATRAWGSVYRNALDGRFDMDIPAARVRMVLISRRQGNQQFVRRLTVLEVFPLEDPHPFAQRSMEKCIEFVRDRPSTQRSFPKHTPLSAAQIAKLTCNNGMTNEQWKVIEPIILKLRTRTGQRPRFGDYPLRELINAIVLKECAPKFWKDVSGNTHFLNCAKATLQKIRHFGAWKEILKQLQDARGVRLL